MIFILICAFLKKIKGIFDFSAYIIIAMEYNNEFDYLKVKYIGEYYSIRFQKDKAYFATRELEYGMLRITDDFGEEGVFMPEEFEVVKVLKNGGMPEDEDDQRAFV